MSNLLCEITDLLRIWQSVSRSDLASKGNGGGYFYGPNGSQYARPCRVGDLILLDRSDAEILSSLNIDWRLLSDRTFTECLQLLENKTPGCFRVAGLIAPRIERPLRGPKEKRRKLGEHDGDHTIFCRPVELRKDEGSDTSNAQREIKIEALTANEDEDRICCSGQNGDDTDNIEDNALTDQTYPSPAFRPERMLFDTGGG